MNLSVEAIVRKANRYLKRTECFKEQRLWECPDEINYQLLYVLTKGDPALPEKIIAYAGMPEEADSVILFWPYGKEDYSDWHEAWGFHFERDLFEDLEDGYELLWMSDETHGNVWAAITNWVEWGDDVEAKEGLQKYLEFCMKNGINKEYLQKDFPGDLIDVIERYGRKKPEAEEVRKHKKARNQEPER